MTDQTPDQDQPEILESVDAPEETAKADESVELTAEALLGVAEEKEVEISAEALLGSVDSTQDDTVPVVEALQSLPDETVEAVAVENVEEEEEEEEEDLLELRPVPEDGLVRRWYALHAHSGQESNVRNMLLQGAEQDGMAHLITNALVPMEKVLEVRSGSKKTAQHKCFPGYVLVHLPEHPEKYPELWHLIKETSGVTGFIGSRTVPVPLEDEEVNDIVEVIRGEKERPKPQVDFEVGERVRIIDGPFANFTGRIDEINVDRSTMKVMVEIFERLTSVEVEFWQVEQP